MEIWILIEWLYLEKLYVIIYAYRIHFCKVSVKSRKFIFGSSARATFPTMNTTGYETHGNGLFQQLDEDTYDTIWNYVGNKQMLKMKKASETEKGGIDMRCAIDEIYEDGLAEGEKRGIAGMLDLLKELGCSANDDVKREDI